MTTSKCEYVYVASGSGMSKIGVAMDVKKRFQHLRGSGAKRLVASWHRPNDALDVEYHVRMVLRPYRNHTFEWFRLPAKLLVQVAEEAIKAVDLGLGVQRPTRVFERRIRDQEEFWERHRIDMIEAIRLQRALEARNSRTT